MKSRSILDSLLRLVHPPASAENLRLLVVSTPRVGNTWMRTLFTKLYGFGERSQGELAVHDPREVPWDTLPSRCILQLHWHKVEPLLSLLREHRFRTMTLARHPLDVLISILQLSQHTGETARWLDSEGGDESLIHGASPQSDAFLEYATGPRARALLSVSLEWWNTSGTLRARYEDLVRDTQGQVGRLTAILGKVEPDQLLQSIASCTLEKLRTPDNAPHFWQGQPGLWRALITANHAKTMASVHRDVFKTFGYTCDPDLALTPSQAEANWAYLRDHPRNSRASKSA